jgi:hypothetical protein
VNKAYLVHINNGYVRDGDIVPEELFVIQDITGVVRAPHRRRREGTEALRVPGPGCASALTRSPKG